MGAGEFVEFGVELEGESSMIDTGIECESTSFVPVVPGTSIHIVQYWRIHGAVLDDSFDRHTRYVSISLINIFVYIIQYS